MKQIKNDKPLYENEKYQIFNDKNGKYVLKLKKGKKVLERGKYKYSIYITLLSLYLWTFQPLNRAVSHGRFIGREKKCL